MFKGDPQRVAEEIYQIGETVTPEQVLDRGRDGDSELHKCFEWDDSAAAERYRLNQAREILRFLVIEKKEDAPAKEPPVRVFYNIETAGGYKPTEIIFQNPDEHQKLLKKALSELDAFQKKYRSLSELEEVFEAIRKIA